MREWCYMTLMVKRLFFTLSIEPMIVLTHYCKLAKSKLTQIAYLN